MAVSWLVAAAGLVGLTEAQASGAGLHLGDVASSSIGSAFVLRGVPLLLAGAALLGLRRLSRVGLGLLGVTTLAAMLGEVLRSHAAAGASWAWLHIGEQWVHPSPPASGLGALPASSSPWVPSGRAPAPPPPGASRSGQASPSWSSGSRGRCAPSTRSGAWHQLHTGFGQLILVKIALFGLLAMLGAVNRFRNVRAVEASASGLRRTGAAELVAMAVVLAATALLQNLAPARTAAAAGVTALSPVVIDTHDFATTYRLHPDRDAGHRSLQHHHARRHRLRNPQARRRWTQDQDRAPLHRQPDRRRLFPPARPSARRQLQGPGRQHGGGRPLAADGQPQQRRQVGGRRWTS